MEVSSSTTCRLLARSWRGIPVPRSRPALSSPVLAKSRGKHHDSCDPAAANLSTASASCLAEPGAARPATHLPVYTGIEQNRNKIAISDVNGDYLYEDVYMRSWDLAKGILGLLGEQNSGRRICFLCPSGLTHVITSWACWMSGNVAVPLCPSSDQARLEHLVQDSGCEVLVTTREQVDRLHPISRQHGQKLIVLDQTWWVEPKKETDQTTPLPEPFVDPELFRHCPALIIYTAGMTGRPKGVQLSHSTLGSQIERVVETWDWGAGDSVLHTLPLATVYGLINSLQAPLSAGARVTLMPKFDPVKVWSHLLGVGVNSGKSVAKINTFPGLPVMYTQLIKTADELFKDKKTRDYVRTTCGKRIRLMMSSTATLPPQITTQWKNMTGHRIMENFISTEAGTALSNRVAGSRVKAGPSCTDCGSPTSKIETQIVRFRDHLKTKYDVLATGDESGTVVAGEEAEEVPVVGELRLRGDSVVKHYWIEGKEEEIETDNGWFNTGDIVQYSKGCYKVWGRLNMVTINHKGNWVNASKIEKKLLSHKDIEDCYVVALGDIQAEQKIAAVVVLTQSKKVNVENILAWSNENMEESEVPTVFKLVQEIARDNSGHVDKIKIKQLFSEENVICFHDSKL